MRTRLALAAALLASGLAAQTAGAPPAVRFDRLGLDLPNPEVQALAQDADGLVWVGTRDGLGRYDGLDLTGVPVAVDGEAWADVRALHVGLDGVLWVGTSRGLARLDIRTDRAERASPSRGDCAGPVAWLAEGGGRALLYGSRALGVCRLDRRTGRVEPVRLPWASASGARAWALQGLTEGGAWVIGPEGGAVCRIDPVGTAGTGGPCRRIDLDGFAPRVLGLDAEGRLIAIGRQGAAWELRRWTGAEFVRLATGLPETGWGETPPLAVVGREAWAGTSTDGVLAVGLETGASRRLGPTPGDPTTLPAFRVRALLVDRQGGAWVGTARGLALWRTPARPFAVYRRFSGQPGEISDDRVNGMAEARDGALWVATNDGLNRLDPESDRFETFRVPPTQAGGPPAWAPAPDDPYRDAWWQVLEAADGTLWIGGKRTGLFRLDRRTGLVRREVDAARALGLVGADGTPRGFGVRHIYEDAAGHLWVGTTGEGLAVRHPDGRWEGVRPGSGRGRLPHPSVNRFYEDAGGRLWVGTDVGVALVSHEEGTSGMAFEPVDLGLEAPVWSLGESAATPGRLWVGTVGEGIVVVDPGSGRRERIAEGEGLPSDLVYGLLSDDAGRVWASTSRGLARITPESGNVAVYDEADGLGGEAFDLMAFFRSPTTGEMWFGGPDGLTRVDPAGVGVAAYRPPVAFTAVRVLDDVRPGRPLDGDTLRFRPAENFLTVQFAALDFTAPRALRYRYRLVGLDEGWRETTGERPFATYTALGPGTYRLEVVGQNADGVWNEEPAVLTVVVEPTWWQGLPARATALLLLALLGVGGVVAAVRYGSRSTRRAHAAVADDLRAGPVEEIGRIGRDLAGVEGAARVRDRVLDVEVGLHDALLQLQPEAARHLELGRALDAVARRFGKAAPGVEVAVGRVEAPGAVAEEVRRDVVAVASHLVAHALRTGDPGRVTVGVTGAGPSVELRVESDARVEASTPLRHRLPGQRNGLVQALRTVRQRGGSLDVEDAAGGSTVVVRLPAGLETAA